MVTFYHSPRLTLSLNPFNVDVWRNSMKNVYRDGWLRWECRNPLSQGIKWCLLQISHLELWYATGLCDSTITEPVIDIDVEILQNFVILRCYWYCKFLHLVIDIDIEIAKEYSSLSLLVLILQDPTNKYQYWYWYAKQNERNVFLNWYCRMC